jgi:hypothetical protein
MASPGQPVAGIFKFQLRAGACYFVTVFGQDSTSRGGINREQGKILTGARALLI